MPYKDPERAKQRNHEYYIANREKILERNRTASAERYHRIRGKFFEGKICVKCRSTNELQLDHIDPTTKITNSVWFWNDERRAVELAKCQVLCKPCHQEKTRLNHDLGTHGEAHWNAKLTEDDVLAIRASQESLGVLAERYGVVKSAIHNVISGKRWSYIKGE